MLSQVSDEAKREVSKEARERAREMAQEALAQRLKEIKMTATEASTYNRVLEVCISCCGLSGLASI